MTVRDADVVVVGAGPAGTAAAITLATAGRRVTVLDKATFPRDKCCGDGLTTLALRELEPLGFRPDAVPSWQPVDAAWVRSSTGREVRLPLPDVGLFAATAPRHELDTALVHLAERAGVEVRTGAAVDRVTTTAGEVEVGTNDGHRVRAATAIAADGAWSPVRRLLGLTEPGYLGEWHAARQYVGNVTGVAAERLCVWFEPDLLPGYAWSFPLPGGRANVGFGVPRRADRHGKQLKALWDTTFRRPHIADALGPAVEWEGRMTAWPIPAAVDRAALTHERVLFVGDAARATDVMTGEGIGQALLTGRLAAEAILTRDAARPDLVAAAYRRSVQQHLFADHRTSLLLTRVLTHPRLTDAAMGVVDRSDWSRRAFARWMFEDAHRSSIVTPWRWHRGSTPRPGAFVS